MGRPPGYQDSGLPRYHLKRDLTKFYKTILCTTFVLTGQNTADCDGLSYVIGGAVYNADLNTWAVRILDRHRTMTHQFIEGELH